ncbi:Uncharacterised protein [Legionella lansingensis]|uniref:Uncharacterized protein n=1 Tax=Legionella lansingensis TaxID=45067 RepID=A0A0W0VL75_9GAMM|nr:hypothetical protein [Legionella lansingensis]KTD20882.1 hypothetical protein Llan_1612 [Legionella lansingensis]SNV43695.1 Uncharacterised protein [Legionella lansingensis]
MGWWDKWNAVKETVKGWGNGIWNVSVTDTADRLIKEALAVPQKARRVVNPKLEKVTQNTEIIVFTENAKELGSKIWNNATLADGVNGLFNFSYNTAGRLLEQLPAVPRVARSVVNPKVRKIAYGIGRIAVEDVLPLVVISYSHQLLQEQGKDYLHDHPNEAWLSAQTVLQLGLWLLWLANGAYSIRKKTQITVRTTVLALEAGGILNSVKPNPPMTLCEQEKCTTLRFLKGSFRDLIEYWATKAAISFIGYIPGVGGGLAAAFNIYHDGRYVITLAVPELCSRHQEQYLREYPELALSHGITHYVLSCYINSMIEHYTGIPSVFYGTTMQQFLLIGQIALATQMTLPPPVRESLRNLPDPVAAYNSLVGFIVDTVLLGLKVQIPRLLREQKAPLLSLEDASRYAEVIWSNPVSENVLKPVLVPRMLRSRKAFINDPVIPWPPLQRRTMHALDNINEVKGYMLTKVALLPPSSMTAKVVRSIFGWPKSVVELLLNLMKNEQFMRQLESIRHTLPALQSGEAPSLPATEGFLLRGQKQETPEIRPPLQIEGKSLDPRQVIPVSQISLQPVDKVKIVEITEEEAKDNKQSEKTSDTLRKRKLDPSLVIRGRKDTNGVGTAGFFGETGKLDPRKVIVQTDTNVSLIT